ncbi:hypothetical protein J27TS7_42690 [Paenibacillus dendritiformis]|nr:hypothetical protein J27TS7_42690 [Paenibacillus dendritiformis]
MALASIFVYKVMFGLNVIFLDKETKNGGENLFEHILHPLGPKAVDGAKIRSLSGCKPHEWNILTHRFGNLTKRIDTLGISLDDDFGEHFRMVVMTSAAWISGGKDLIIQTIHRSIDDTNEVICRDIFFQVHWQAQLAHVLLNVQRNRSFRRWLVVLPFY